MIMEFEKLQEIIADVMNVTKDDVQPETKFVEDLSRIRWISFRSSQSLRKHLTLRLTMKMQTRS